MLHRLSSILQQLAITLWVGALWVVGFVVAPTLFHMIPDRVQAGEVAGRFFSIVSYIGLSCGTYLLLHSLLRGGRSAFRQYSFWVVCLMLVLVAAGQFGVQPILSALKDQALPDSVMHSALRDRFTAWHGIASAIYIVECLLGLALVVLQTKTRC